MKKSVSFQEEDPPLFSYPPESEGSDDDSRGFDYPSNFLWNVDYSMYADWDFQSSLDLEEIPEDIVEVEDPENDDEYLSFRYKSFPLRPIQVYTFTDITDDDEDYSESASLKTNLSEVGLLDECTDSQENCLDVKSVDDSPSPSSSVPSEVCQEVIEMYPNFDDLSVMFETSQNEISENSYHRNDSFTDLNIEDSGDTRNISKFKENCYIEFAKADDNLSLENCNSSEGLLTDSENAIVSSGLLEKPFYHEIRNIETPHLIKIHSEKDRQESKLYTKDNMLNSIERTDLQQKLESFCRTEKLDEIDKNTSQGNCVIFQQNKVCCKEINDTAEKAECIEHNSAATGASLNQIDWSNSEEKDKCMCLVDAEFLTRQLPDKSDVHILEVCSSASLSPADISINIANTSSENCEKSTPRDITNTKEFNFDNSELVKNMKDVVLFETEKSVGNLNRPNSLHSQVTDSKSSVQQCHDSALSESQTFSSTYIANDHSHDLLYLAKDSRKCCFVSKLNNCNIANDSNLNMPYCGQNSDNVAIASVGLQDSTNNVIYEDAAEGECSLSSKSTEDSSEKDSAISSGGEFSPAYSPGILQENGETIWDFQHASSVDGEKSAMVENCNAGPELNTDNSAALLPAIVVSDSNNVNFTIHNASVLQTCNNFRYEHNGNIPTDLMENIATAGCDRNDNIV